MAANDILIYEDGAFGYPGDVDGYVVASGTCAEKIKVGEPVYIAVDGDGTATALATNLPSSANAASNISGIAASTSTDTTAAAGKVSVMRLNPNVSYLIAPNATAYTAILTNGNFTTQADYDGLVGRNVLLDLTGTPAAGTAKYTALITHNAAYACTIMPLDTKKYPGKVRFSIRPAATTQGWATGIS